MTTSTLLRDFAVIVTAAAGAAALAPRLRLPVLPAYLLTGIGLGLWHRAMPGVLGDVDAIGALSNLGVTFLMFAIGLDFDFSKASALFIPAGLAVVIQSFAMFALGGAAASAMGFTPAESMFLGGLFCISSTMISVASLRDSGHLERNYARLTLGVLVLEDIAAVALLAILAGLGAPAHGGASTGVVSTLLLVGAFMTLLLAGGRLLIRRWLPTLALEKRPDALAVVVGGLVLGTGLIAEHFEYSPALGAFVLGAALAQSRMAKPIEEIAEPLRHLFSAVFFVTLGVSVKPAQLIETLPFVIPITILLIVGKTLACWLGAFLGGAQSSSSMRMALNKAHIGEFSFVIAALGERAGVTSPKVTAVAAGCALLSILAHRPIAANTERIIAKLAASTPAALRQAADLYGNLLSATSNHFDSAALWRIVRSPLRKSGLHLLFFFSSAGVAHLVCRQAQGTESSWPEWAPAAIWIAASVVAMPFAVALARNLEAILMLLIEGTLAHRMTHARVVRAINLVTRLIQFIVVLLLGLAWLGIASPWLPSGAAPLVAAVVLGLSAWLFRHALSRAQSRFEVLFVESFNKAAREDEANRRSAVLHKMVRKHKWPLHIREHKVAPGTRAAGVKLSALALRGETGVFVSAIQRDGHTVFAPDPGVPIFPGDELMLLGTGEQLDKAVALLGEAVSDEQQPELGFLMDQAFVAHDAPIVDETLAGAALRRLYGVTIAGVQRGEKQHLSPGPDFIIKSGDVLLVAGRVDDVIRFKSVAAGGLAQNGS